DQLLHKWLLLDQDSAWMENLMRVIQFREMPADIRFFMAYTALQGFGEELGKGPLLKDSTVKEKARVWKAFEVYWRHLLFPLKEPPEAYVMRLIRTRHHFAHRSNAKEDILRTFEEYSAGFFRIMIVLKVMFMDAAGVPEESWKLIMEQWSMRVQLALHPHAWALAFPTGRKK
ncbi:MAG: hypothetical protein ABIY71_12305, partial [Flavobacteriales bacterium]